MSEFDETKRSCRKRLSHHNARRRKSQGVFPFNPDRVYGKNLLHSFDKICVFLRIFASVYSLICLCHTHAQFQGNLMRTVYSCRSKTAYKYVVEWFVSRYKI